MDFENSTKKNLFPFQRIQELEIKTEETSQDQFAATTCVGAAYFVKIANLFGETCMSG